MDNHGNCRRLMLHSNHFLALSSSLALMFPMSAVAQVGTDNEPFVGYYSETRNCVRSAPQPADSNGLSKGWSYECIAQDEVVFVLSLIDKCPSVAINMVKRVSPDKKKTDIICVFLASDVQGSDKLVRGSVVAAEPVPSPMPAFGIDGCPAGSSRRVKKGFLGMGKKDYGCLTDYEYAEIRAREGATNAAIMMNTMNSIERNKPVNCYGTGFTTGGYGMTQTFANASCY